MVDNLLLGANGAIATCYFTIAFLIFQALVRGQRHLLKNPLALATAAIFLTCALGHSAHILVMATSQHHDVPTLWMGFQVVVDFLTAIVAVTYLALRQQYSILIDGPLLFAQTHANQRRTEAVLQERDSILRTVTEGTTDAVFMKDVRGRYVMLNSATARIVGKPVQDILGRDDTELLPPEIAAQLKENDGKVVLSEVAQTYEETLPVAGELRTFLSTKTLCRDDRGNIIGTIGVARDITDRKQTEQALRDALQKLSFHVENSPLAVVEWNDEFRLQRWSQQAEEIFGWKAEEVIGKSWQDWQFVFEDDLEQASAVIAGLTNGGKPSIVSRNRNYTKSGEVIYCEWYNSALSDESGKLVSVLSLVQDVSDRQRAEAQVRELNQVLERRVAERTAQLEATNKELEAFSYSVSHDLRAPLRSIDGFSQALLERYNEQLDDKGKHYLNRVRAASQRMGHLIDDLLNLSRVTRSEMHYQTVDLSALVQAIATELQQLQPERPVELSITPKVLVRADRRLLRVALENLLNNAWKFTANQKQPRIEFGTTPHSPLTYFIRDNGAGFDMAYADKLFKAFQRLHGTDEFPGNGIGLATVQRVINRHGGQVWAEGAIGQGATFYFTLEQDEMQLQTAREMK